MFKYVPQFRRIRGRTARQGPRFLGLLEDVLQASGDFHRGCDPTHSLYALINIMKVREDHLAVGKRVKRPGPAGAGFGDQV
jgi:hypothetical protein